MKVISLYRLAIKYWLQGDEWGDALIFARRIVYGFR